MAEKMLESSAANGGAGFAGDGRRPQAGASNDDMLSPERTARVAASIDDPCDEGGYDAFCRDDHGQLCRFNEQHCHAPDYPCIDLLRHALAVSFLEEIVQRRAGAKS